MIWRLSSGPRWSYIVSGMALQDPEDWEFPLIQIPEVLIPLSQPSISRRRLRDEDEPSERHIQPRLDFDPQQPPLRSLRTLQLGTRVLVIILEVEALLIGGHQVVFEECFKNTNGLPMVTRLFNDIGYRLYLQGPLTHLDGKWRVTYIAAVLRQILDFLHI